LGPPPFNIDTRDTTNPPPIRLRMVSGIDRLLVYCIRGLSEAICIRLLREVCVELHNRLIQVFNSLWTVSLSETKFLYQPRNGMSLDDYQT
jgi:hypothetical protein